MYVIEVDKKEFIVLINFKIICKIKTSFLNKVYILKSFCYI